MAKFTPGPWIRSKDGLGPMSVYGPDSKGIWHEDRSEDETEANAALIAAAPELLGELKRLLPVIGWHGSGENAVNGYYCEYCTAYHEDNELMQHLDGCPVPRLKAVIAKAEGVSNG